MINIIYRVLREIEQVQSRIPGMGNARFQRAAPECLGENLKTHSENVRTTTPDSNQKTL
jgi:hypothetical protein